MLSLSFGSWAPRVSRRAWIRGANVHVPTARVRDERKRRRGQHNAPEALHVLKSEDRMSRHERRSLMKPAIRVAGRNQYNRKRRWAEEGSAGLDARRYFGVHVSSNLKSSGAPQRRIRSAALMGYVRTCGTHMQCKSSSKSVGKKGSFLLIMHDHMISQNRIRS